MRTLIFTLSVISLVACSNEDKPAETPQQSQPTLVGKWQKQKTVYISGTNGVTISELETNDCERQGYLEFTADNKVGELSFYSGMVNNVVTCVQNTPQAYNSYEYNSTTKKITVTSSTTTTVDVLNLTATDFVTSGPTSDRNNDGIADKKVQNYIKR
ncbi:lipocalin family protein [Flavobacterium psychrophilum]|uniref:lipocalin family protein n=1 Tax=Flavobacterium psychrophilum TaxID=96345 RepID=UPI000B7C5251|nr:lipocalin family protein [Flavobacterium psychrophilum]EKT4499158.1 hypothetical protein [Flavobacterium psychrophilum]EKT4552044.1 hypothetical protein [Flavobacterium psychrophilum]ELM3650817.1 hypothetical protein [Flavobacterium psychrophilum]ELM3671471.1 hypothetical protein [Flavobacterium psychrophilum]ELM3726005.1 hypothetical protein [Flavobacterium psychrophilum]